MITAEQLKAELSYDPETGVFRWRKNRPGRRLAGHPAGTLSSDGYIHIQINRKQYKASRLAWMYTHGHLPKNEIDHIDGNRSNDRIANLRDVTHRQNLQNRTEHRNGKLVGCNLQDKYAKKPWQAQIRIDGFLKFLGHYRTECEAHEAYMKALSESEDTGR